MSTTRHLLQSIPMQFSNREIQAVLRNYPALHGVRLVDVQPVSSGFSGALVYCIRTSTCSYCLRRWPEPGLPMLRIIGLHQLLRHISNQGLQTVAVPVTCQTGETLTVMPNGYWQLEPWLPGNANFHANPHPDRLKSAMYALAAWHNSAANYFPNAAHVDWFDSRVAVSPAVTERYARLCAWQKQQDGWLQIALQNVKGAEFKDLAEQQLQLFQQSSDWLRLRLEQWMDKPFRLQPCLRDIWHDHVLFTENKVTGLIDPSAARTENVATDLARLLGTLIGNEPMLWQAALDAYAERASLSEQERDLTLVLDQSAVILSGMVWLDRLVDEQSRPFHIDQNGQINPAVIGRMRSLVMRHHKLVQRLQ